MTDRGTFRRLFGVLRHHPAVAALATAAGAVEVHLVGGVLRDRLLGLGGHDFDAVVAGDGEAIAARVAAALDATLVALGGRAFAAYRVVGRAAGEPFVVDVWDRTGTPLVDDLARRDFTVDSFALDLASGELIDPFGGVDDLGRRVLRATTQASFTADPLRVLRLPRLVAQLPGFAAGPATLALARASAPGLAEIASERVREELARTFASDEAHRALALLAALDLYPGLWLGSPGQPGPTGGAVGETAAVALAHRELRRLSPAADDQVDLPAARLAASFAHLPEPAAPLAPAGPSDPTRVDRFAAAGYLVRKTAERVKRLLAERRLPSSELEQRRFLHRLGPLWPTAAVRLGAAAVSGGGGGGGGAEGGALDAWRRDLARLVALVAADGPRILDPPRLLTGDEVQRLLGIPAGERVGAALAAIERAQVEGRVRTRGEAEALLARG